MKKTFTLLILFCAPLLAQNYKSGSISGTTCFGIDTTNAGTIGISVQNSSTGSAWSGTIQPSASIGGDPAGNIQVTPSTGGAAQSTITANGVYIVAASGYTYVQVCGNTVTNTAAIKMFPAQYSKNIGGGGGSGSGTVSANNGSAGALAIYAAAGGSTTVGPDATLVDNGATLTYSGTTGIVAPSGAAATPGLVFSGATTTGLSRATTNIVFDVAGVAQAAVNSAAGLELPLGNWMAWSGSSDPTATVATTISQPGTKVIYVGAGGDDSGFIHWNQCRITADITLPVNTATTVCSWTLPVSIAKAWGWQCQLPWVISAGTGTNTLAIGVNLSVAPTGATAGEAEIKTTNTNTATEAYTAIPASSGATTLLTSGTITPTATVFVSSTSGTVLLPAASNTFSIQMTAAGTTATAAAKVGGTCFFY